MSSISVLLYNICLSHIFWQDWSNLLQETLGPVNLSAGAVGIGQTFCWRGQDWSNVLLDGVKIGQPFCGSCQYWSNFLRELLGLVKHCAGVVRIGKYFWAVCIGQTFCGRGQDETNVFKPFFCCVCCEDFSVS